MMILSFVVALIVVLVAVANASSNEDHQFHAESSDMLEHESKEQINDILSKLESTDAKLSEDLKAQKSMANSAIEDTQARLKAIEERIKKSHEQHGSVADRFAEYRTKSTDDSLKSAERHQEFLSRQREGTDRHRERMEKAMNDAKLARESMRSHFDSRGSTQETWMKEMEERRASVGSAARRDPKASLEKFAVEESLVEEINRLAGSKVAREGIVDHVRTHHPDRTPEELNDIVVGALMSKRKEIPHSALDRAKEREKLLEKMRVERKFESHNAQKEHHKEDL